MLDPLFTKFPISRSWHRLYIAFLISSFGDQFTRVALFAKVYELGGEVSGLTAVVLAQSIPSLIVSPLVGALSDRGRKRDYLLISDLARCILLALIAWCYTLSGLIVLAALVSTFSAMFRPVEASFEADLLTVEDITKANVIRMGTRQLLSIIGPAVAGACLAAFTVSMALLVDAVTYGISGLFILGLPGRQLRQPTSNALTLRGELWAGLGHIFSDRRLRQLFVVSIVLILLLGMQGPLLYGFVAQQLQGGGESFGVLMSGLGVGALLSALLLGQWPRIHEQELRVLILVLAIDAAALLGFTYGTNLVVCTFFMTLMGALSSVFMIVIRVHLQTRTPAVIRGRVLGWFEGIQGPLQILSLALVLPLASRWSAAQILRGAALAEMTVAVLSTKFLLGFLPKKVKTKSGSGGS